MRKNHDVNCCQRCYFKHKPEDVIGMDRMILCSTCGNKRCPRATDHRLECTNSNEPGQIGSAYGTPLLEPMTRFESLSLHDQGRLRYYVQSYILTEQELYRVSPNTLVGETHDAYMYRTMLEQTYLLMLGRIITHLRIYESYRKLSNQMRQAQDLMARIYKQSASGKDADERLMKQFEEAYEPVQRFIDEVMQDISA